MNPPCLYHCFYHTSNPPADYSVVTKGEMAETIDAIMDENMLLRHCLQQAICRTALFKRRIQTMIDQLQPIVNEATTHGKK